MESIEYTKMAYLYDKFYINKNYSKEVNFIKSFTTNNAKILDAGCGTGNHAKILHNLGYDVIGFDKSKDMINIANTKVENHFFVDDLLSFHHKEKFDLIISFFAVFNHLKNYKEFKLALSNLKSTLKDNGTIIIDLHNPQKNGQKKEVAGNAIRVMKWRKCSFTKKEFSKITYFVDGKIYKTKNCFKIFSIKKLHSIAKELGFTNISFYENYDNSTSATIRSKNIQMILIN